MKPILCFCLGLSLLSRGASAADDPAITDPAHADADFLLQGEYEGAGSAGGKQQKLGLQAVALGAGKFHGVLHLGGLPATGNPRPPKQETDGEAASDGTVAFKHPEWTIKIKGLTARLTRPDGRPAGQLKRVERKSPTLDAKPPKGAIVLFDGTGVEAWEDGAKVDQPTSGGDKLLVQGATTRKKFGSARIHVEFRTPYKPTARGQARGNSGVYLQGRYEAQVLDSFGLEGRNNEAGGIYEVKDPLGNMAFPPLSWQTYDIEFHAAKFDGAAKVASARATVKLNGVVVQKDTEIPGPTRAAPVKESAEPGPIHLQDHGNPVRYRNIWLVPQP